MPQFNSTIRFIIVLLIVALNATLVADGLGLSDAVKAVIVIATTTLSAALLPPQIGTTTTTPRQ